jgi:hypothetical protein
MDRNYSTIILGSKIDVVCAWVGGASTTPYLNSGQLKTGAPQIAKY